jgi:hypothetical protein
MKAKYKTLAELKAAIDSKEVYLGDSKLTIDNDSCILYEEEIEDKDENGTPLIIPALLFDGGNPEELLKEALDLLGIPNQPA